MLPINSSQKLSQGHKHNNPVNAQQLKLLGPPLRRPFCALIAQNNQLRSGPLPGRYEQ